MMNLKLVIRLICYVLLVCLVVCANAFSNTLVNPSLDMTYVGAFKLPPLPDGYVWSLFDGAGYNKGGMSFYPPNDTLLVMGGPGRTVATRRYVAEVGIPEIIKGEYDKLKYGTLLHELTDVIGKDTAGTYANLGDIHYFTKQGSQKTDKFYISMYGSYNTQSIYKLFNGQFAWTEANLDALNLKGWWRFDDLGVRYSGKYIFHLPTDWADTHVEGKRLVTGFYRGGGGVTYGPTLYAYAPWESCGSDCEAEPPPDAEDGDIPGNSNNPRRPELKHTLPYMTLLQYSGKIDGHTINDAAPNDKYGDGEWVTVGRKSAVVLYGWKSMRFWKDFRWQYPNAPVFVSTPNKGYHDEPGYPALFFFDIKDLAAVADGKKAPYEPQPYAVVNLLPYFYYKKGLKFSTDGMAYDEKRNILYLRESVVSGRGGYQAIHAFRLSDIGRTLDTISPSSPRLKLDAASHESVKLSWEASSDNSHKPIIYEVYRNNTPVAITTATYFRDDTYEYYPSPVKYNIVAKDFRGNTSSSSVIYVDESNGGNAPINIFISTLGNTSSEHETSTALKIRKNKEYFFQPRVVGGGPPYVWSATGLPKGLKIDKGKGIITGNAGRVTESKLTIVISVVDSFGNICRRRTAFKVFPASVQDLDGDNYKALTDGGLDEDDTTIMINPLHPTQPAPTGLRVTSNSHDSVELNWVAAKQRQHIGWEPAWNKEKDWRRYQGDITYKIYYGTSLNYFNHQVYVGRTTTYTLTDLPLGKYYFAVTAFSYRGLESEKTNEAVFCDIR